MALGSSVVPAWTGIATGITDCIPVPLVMTILKFSVPSGGADTTII
jgi:hypothetical protein